MSNKEQNEEKYDQIEETKARSSFSALKVVLYTLLTLFIIGASVAGIGGYYIYSNLQPADPENEEMIQVEIPLGSAATRISSILKEEGIIKHEKLFYYYVRLKGHGGFQAGEYYLSPSMEKDDIIEQLKEGRVYQESERFTIPEGYSIEQVALHLEEQGFVNKERFLDVAENGDFSEYPFMAEIPEEEDRKFYLEGLLFPETYEIYKGADEEAIIQRMLRQFEKELEQIKQQLHEEHPNWEEALQEKNLSLYDAIKLASIIEREAVLDEERATISGIFHNRLEEGWLLQSCATVQFVLGKQRDRLLFEDLEVESPYNTYIHEGLPPSPIASPGRASLKAALAPEEHDYFFFVTKKDGTGAHHFSRTYEEHLQNNAQSRGNF